MVKFDNNGNLVYNDKSTTGTLAVCNDETETLVHKGSSEVILVPHDFAGESASASLNFGGVMVKFIAASDDLSPIQDYSGLTHWILELNLQKVQKN